MEFRQFHYILKIAEEGTLSLAAKKLYVSQPSLSQLLAAQEKKIGAPLFDRGGTHLTPTAIGRIYPEITLHLREDTTYRLEELAEAGEADCIISLLPINEHRFSYDILFEERLVLAIPSAHSICAELGLIPGDYKNLPIVPLRRLRNTPFLLMHREQKLHDTLFSLCEAAGFLPQITLETRSMNTAHALAGAGLGAAILPETLIAAAPPAHPPCYAAIEGDPHRTIILARAKKRYQPRAVAIFREELQAFCAKQA